MSADDARKGSAFRSWIRTNQGVGACLTAVLCLYLIYLEFSPWVHERLRDGFTLGFFPVMGVIAMLICTALFVFDRHRHETIDELVHMRWSWFVYCFAVLIGCGAYFYLTLELGFLLATPVFLLAFIYTLGVRPWTSCLIAGVVMTVVVYVVFLLLGIELPSGILPF